ncbi:MAG: glycosyltransferase family 4 protein [Nitrospinales bacterium]
MQIALLQFPSIKGTADYKELAKALRDIGHTVWIGEPDQTGNLHWHDGKQIIAIQRRPIQSPKPRHRETFLTSISIRLNQLCFILRVRKYLLYQQPEIVQVNPAALVWFWILPIFMPTQIVLVVDFRQLGLRDTSTFLGRIKNKFRKWRMRLYIKVLFHRGCFLHSAGAAQILGSSWNKWSSVVPLGVNPTFLNFKYIKPIKSPDGIIRFVYLGGLSRRRRLEQIIYASQRILTLSKNFQVVFIGPDKSQGFYHRLIDKLGLKAFVTIKATVRYEKVPAELSKYDVALAYVPDQPADWRYHPTLKILEYRALGMPIIATDYEPNREIVIHGTNGLLIKNSVNALAESMLRFMNDQQFFKHCHMNARNMRYGTPWCDVASMYEKNVYQKLKN